MPVITTQPGSTNPIVGNKPSVLDMVRTWGRKDAPIFEALGKGKKVANPNLHSWISDKIPEPSMNVDAVSLEVSPHVAAPASTKFKTSNVVEIFKTSHGLSWDQQSTDNYGQKEVAHQRMLATTNHAQKIEYRILGLGRNASAKASVFTNYQERSDTQPGRMAGLFLYVAKGETGYTNGWRGHINAVDTNEDWTGTATPLTIKMLDEFVGKPWDIGAAIKRIYVGRNLKSKICSLFERQLTNEKRANINIVNIELSCGQVEIYLHSMLTDHYGLGDVIIGCDPQYGSVRPLTERVDKIPMNDTTETSQIYTSLTLEVNNPNGFAIMVGAGA